MPTDPAADLTILKQEIRAARDVLLKVLDDLDARVDSLLPPATATRYQALIGIDWQKYLAEASPARRPHADPSKHRKDRPRCSG